MVGSLDSMMFQVVVLTYHCIMTTVLFLCLISTEQTGQMNKDTFTIAHAAGHYSNVVAALPLINAAMPFMCTYSFSHCLAGSYLLGIVALLKSNHTSTMTNTPTTRKISPSHSLNLQSVGTISIQQCWMR